MQRLAKYDVSRRFKRRETQIAAQIGFGMACATVLIGIRAWIDPGMSASASFAFAFIYPTVLIATLYGHWPAGLVAATIALLWIWFFVLPPPEALPALPLRALLHAICVLIVLILAESFRRAMMQAMAQRDAEIERRTMLLRELEHRTKNNFALVVSILETQKRKESEPRIRSALNLATSRIHSFARAYANLAEVQREGAMVAMQPYLSEVAGHFRGGGLAENIAIRLEIAECHLQREQAVAIGLFTNEALTNAAKYAFPDGRPGEILVRMDHSGGAEAGARWEVLVSDNGVGKSGGGSGPASSSGGLGTTLMKAFARQAQAEYHLDATDTGWSVRLLHE